MADIQRISIGLEGHQSLDLRVTDEAYRELRNALEGTGERGWHLVPTQDSEVIIDLSKVVYLSLAAQDQRVGF
ncbi:MAG: hypothetical protein ACJ76Z_04805 [Thermoleophilaceae bacterium]